VSDTEERPFEATPRRVARARREGDIARSSELAANCSFAAAGFAVAVLAGPTANLAADALARAASLRPASSSLLILAAGVVPMGCASLAGALAALVQNGGLTFVPIVAKLERLNPGQGLRRVISRETLNHSLRATLAFACAACAMLPSIIVSTPSLIGAWSIERGVAQAWSCAIDVVVIASAVGLLFAIVEYAAARNAWLRRLRMTFQERKREQKEEEGDAVARGRRSSLHRALLRGGIARVKEAAFVVVNPLHIAVALAYAPPRVSVPEVLVRAAGDPALHVRELAASYRIPIVANPMLARALYRDVRSGEKIPHVHYLAVAEVVAALIRAHEISP
jgi:flagellar biosynthetic protein FlhB